MNNQGRKETTSADNMSGILISTKTEVNSFFVRVSFFGINIPNTVQHLKLLEDTFGLLYTKD